MKKIWYNVVVDHENKLVYISTNDSDLVCESYDKYDQICISAGQEIANKWGYKFLDEEPEDEQDLGPF